MINGRKAGKKMTGKVKDQEWQCQFSCKSQLLSLMGKRLGLMVTRLRFWSPFRGERCRRSERLKMRYFGLNKEEIETWLKNIIVLFPKKKIINKLEEQTRENLRSECLGQVVLWMFHHLVGDGVETSWKEEKELEQTHTFGFEEGRSATDISTAIRLLAAAARGSGPELGFVVCSLDVKQAFHNVSPLNLNLFMK